MPTYTLDDPPADPGNTGKLGAPGHNQSLLHSQKKTAINGLDARLLVAEVGRSTWGAAKVANFTWQASDEGLILPCSHATGLTGTIPKDVYASGAHLLAEQTGAGPLTIVGATGVTFGPIPGVPSGGAMKTLGQGSWVEFVLSATANLWEPLGAFQVREAVVLPVPISPLGANAATGDKIMIPVPALYAGYSIVGATLALVVPATGGSAPSVGVRRVRAGVGVEVFTTNVTVDVNETDSSTAANPVAINATNAVLALADQLIFHIDQIGTGGSQGYVATLILN